MYQTKSKQKIIHQNSGFTLIEILVVMVILGVLMTLGAGAFKTAQLKSRDAKRKGDLKHVVEALEMYRNDLGVYPADNSAGLIYNGAVAVDWGETFTHPTATTTLYMENLPADPSTNGTYFYIAGASLKSYQLYARLENNLDRDVPVNGSYPQVYTLGGLPAQACGVDDCNYGVSSSNTNPAAGKTLVND